jgi:hypothetical protein
MRPPKTLSLEALLNIIECCNIYIFGIGRQYFDRYNPAACQVPCLPNEADCTISK